MLNCKSILIVEDDEDIRATVQEVLRMEGYRAFAAKDGQEALDLLKMIPHPTLIFLDLMMPGMDGWAFLEERKKVPFLSECPVVLTSAVPEGRALVDGAGVAQVEGLLKKPLLLESILSVVQDYCYPEFVANEISA